MISWLKTLIWPAQVVSPSQALPPVQPELPLAPAAQDPAQVSTFAMDQTKNAPIQVAPATAQPKEKPPVDPARELFVRTLYESLRIKLDDIWRTVQNSPWNYLKGRSWEAGDLPRTGEICKAIVEARARELGVKSKDIIVAVPGHSDNYNELLAWLETGAKVYAIELGAAEYYKTVEGSRLYFKYRPRLRPIEAGRPLPKRADIVVWTYPNALNYPDMFQDLLKDDGLFIIQSELSPLLSKFFEDTGRWSVVFSKGISKDDFFMESNLLELPNSRVAIFKRPTLSSSKIKTTPFMDKFARLMGMTGDKLIATLEDSGDMFDEYPAHISEECISCQDHAALAINTLKGEARTEFSVDSAFGENSPFSHSICLLFKNRRFYAVDAFFWLANFGMPDTYEKPHKDLANHRLIPLEDWLAGLKNMLNTSGKGSQRYRLTLRADGGKIKRIIASADELI